MSSPERHRRPRVRRAARLVAKGSTGPQENDSRFLLDPHRRGLPNLPRMARYRDDEEVDLLVIGAGAGGCTLAQRLARRGWRIVVLESGPFWDPDRDWVSDEAGSSKLYWTEPRVIGGEDPVELGKNNSGHGVGGSMVHYAGYAPRFHPSDFRTRSLDGVGVDWPIAYEDLRPHYERVEAELPVAGQDWPRGDPHRYSYAPHPVSAGAQKAREGGAPGRRRVPRGAGGDRERCVREPAALHLPGFLPAGVQGQRQGFAADHPPARRDRARRRGARRLARRHDRARPRRAGQRRVLPPRRRDPLPAGRRCGGRRVFDRNPRLLLHSTSPRFPNGIGNQDDQVGRYLMVQGAPQVAGRFPELLGMYKGPPPEICSEQFYETDESRGFARGFAIQTVGPQPIAWAEHVLADGHWGQALREYMRDYNHWFTLGTLCELLPLAENRITLAQETDSRGVPVARMDYTQCDNDRANIAHAKATLHRIWEAAGAQDVLAIDRYAHLVGGCRMGRSPLESVVDAEHRVWGLSNLFIADGSVMPTQGSANPALTIMALASRLAERLAEQRIDARRAA